MSSNNDLTEHAQQIATIIDTAKDVCDRPIELKDAQLTQREALLEVCDQVSIWRTQSGEIFASVPVGDHVEHHALNSQAFRCWMLGGLAKNYAHNGRPASASESAVREARMMLEARSLIHAKQHEASLRVADHDGAMYIDLGNENWSAVEISKSGWQIVGAPPVPILRGKRTAAFPLPSTSGDFDPLRQLLSGLSREDYIMFVAWCLAALAPHGPYPILILGGEAGSGKSTLARLAQRIADPINGDLLQPPHDDRDLIAAARHNRVLAFDNLSGMQIDLADSLCRLATGSEIGGRALYSDHETASFSASRPVILNGIPDLAARGDLADRSIVLKLQPLKERVTERDIRKSIEAALPSVFGALLNALMVGLKRIEDVTTPDVRMADFAQLIIAAEPALPWNKGDFLAAYERNRGHATFALVEGDLVASMIRTFADENPEGWSGLVSELYQILSYKVPLEAKRDWPNNARWFSDRLRRASPSLRALGIIVAEHRIAQGQQVTIGRAATLPTPATHRLPPGGGEDVSNVASVATEQACDASRMPTFRMRL